MGPTIGIAAARSGGFRNTLGEGSVSSDPEPGQTQSPHRSQHAEGQRRVETSPRHCDRDHDLSRQREHEHHLHFRRCSSRSEEQTTDADRLRSAPVDRSQEGEYEDNRPDDEFDGGDSDLDRGEHALEDGGEQAGDSQHDRSADCESHDSRSVR